jgi:hypothetical protein
MGLFADGGSISVEPGGGLIIWTVLVLLTLVALLVCGLKGRLWWMVVGLFIFPVAWFGALQSAGRGSPWAKWRP